MNEALKAVKAVKAVTNVKENENTSISKGADELVVKDVDLFGDMVMVAQDKDGVIWVGVRWLCEGLGLSEGQVKSERKKIKEDLVVSKGGRNLVLPTNGGSQDALCLQLDYIPLWLAKISITPNMKENNPELVDKLVKYQLKAKDVLAAAFLPESVSGSFDNAYNQQINSGQLHFTNIPHTLEYNNEPVITTTELAKHYRTSSQSILNAFYRHENYFDKEIHYFLLEANEGMKFRKENGLNPYTKLYLWTKKGSIMFTKIINNEIGWNQYKRILDILMDKINGCENVSGVGKGTLNTDIDSSRQLPDNTGRFLLQDKWYLKNAYKIERICKALGMDKKEFYHMVINKVQEKYNMKSIENEYKDRNGTAPEYAMDIIDCFSELSEIADNVLTEYMLLIVDNFSLLKKIASAK